MNTKNLIDCERQRLEKLYNFQLPHYFKFIGLAVFIISLLLLMSRILFPEQPEIFKLIAKTGFVIGMLIISISKEKIEDEMIIKLRAKSYALAFVIGVCYTITMPYVDFGVSNVVSSGGESFKGLGHFQILSFMLMIQLMFYYTFKRSR